jgi:hypothetical protein
VTVPRSFEESLFDGIKRLQCALAPTNRPVVRTRFPDTNTEHVTDPRRTTR